MDDVCVIKLPRKDCYAVVTPGLMTFALEATIDELNQLVDQMSHDLPKPEDEPNDNNRGSALGLMPTFDCNLACVYCYARGGESKEVMHLEIGKAAIKHVADTEKRDSLRLFLVGGGEPLLYFDLVKELVEYAQTLFNHVEINVVTNGTFGTPVREWLLAHRASIRVSFDGVMQEKQRPFANGDVSVQTVEANIRELVASGADLTIQTIVTSFGLSTIKETLDHLYAMGVRHVKIEPALATAVSRAGLELEPDPKAYALALLDAILWVRHQNYEMTIDTGFFTQPSGDHYCGMSTTNRVVTPHGLVTACVEVARPTDPYANTLLVGQLNSGKIDVDPAKREVLRSFHVNNQAGGCPTCNLRLICHGGCPMANIWRNGLPLRKSSFNCTVEKVFVPNLLLAIAEDPQVLKIVAEDVQVDC